MAEPRDEVEQELAATLVWRQRYDAMIPAARAEPQPSWLKLVLNWIVSMALWIFYGTRSR
jgi:hypothetical protein